jgi:hypothetical protein
MPATRKYSPGGRLETLNSPRSSVVVEFPVEIKSLVPRENPYRKIDTATDGARSPFESMSLPLTIDNGNKSNFTSRICCPGATLIKFVELGGLGVGIKPGLVTAEVNLPAGSFAIENLPSLSVSAVYRWVPVVRITVTPGKGAADPNLITSPSTDPSS